MASRRLVVTQIASADPRVLTTMFEANGPPARVVSRRWLSTTRAAHQVLRFGLAVAAAMLLAGCRADTRPAPNTPARFHNVGAWSGHGDAQTGSFTSDTGAFRVRWEARNETRPGAGRLKVVFHSGDSGRPIMDAVDATGIGRAVAYVSDRVRWYYLVIESSDEEWSVSVDEDLGERPVRDTP